MQRWCFGLLGAISCIGSSGIVVTQAWAQTGNGVNSGLNSDGGAMSGPNINRVNGINANGTPRQQLPGSSMTNGAGNSTMTPGVVPPTVTVAPTINGTGKTHSTVNPTGPTP